MVLNLAVKAGLGLAVGAVGVGKQISASRSVARSQRSIADLSQRQQALNARLRRRQAIRASIIQRARSQAAGVAVGGQESSSAFGGFSSLSSQLGSGLGFQSQGTGISRQINNLNGQISSAQQGAQLGSGLQSLGFSLFNNAGGFGAFR